MNQNLEKLLKRVVSGEISFSDFDPLGIQTQL